MEAPVTTKSQLQITHWKPYPAYKDSGVEWLDLPEWVYNWGAD